MPVSSSVFKPTIVGDIILLPRHLPTQKEPLLNLMVETLHGFPQTLPALRSLTL